MVLRGGGSGGGGRGICCLNSLAVIDRADSVCVCVCVCVCTVRDIW